MNGISDRGSIPLSSIALKCWKYSILGLLLYKESALFAILDHFRPLQTKKNVVKIVVKQYRDKARNSYAK